MLWWWLSAYLFSSAPQARRAKQSTGQSASSLQAIAFHMRFGRQDYRSHEILYQAPPMSALHKQKKGKHHLKKK